MIPLRRRLAFVLAAALLQSALYFTLNRAPLRASRELALTALDRAVPFWPWKTWPYLVLLAAEVALPLFVRGRAEFARLVVAYGSAITVAFAVQAAWPTRYPRPPLPAGAGAVAYRVLAALDTPECCFPSCHVLVPLVAAWSVRRDRGSWASLVLVLALVPSVLTTKQHYAADVLGGMVLAALAVAFAALVVPRESAKDARGDAARTARGA